ncbi:isochorismate synthase [Paenibacillus cellulosilyticus]|uniref:isochorismate synthase n=1 Tax=Paenibacillus cellulosilyticus TaxID=375489 RepID=A0A2V2YL28_9BACL|nr:isochorismate synthase DhbC [Paenibacillus cellulosilyticus]PWV93786.1 isochorismate synthase [Paenibacillus cellulosilyticus]QKS47404.1 isochorismate synthase DhbC [Paenibacillus cellulosilyticus]
MKQSALTVLTAQLLDGYRPGAAFFLSTPNQTLLAEGTFMELTEADGACDLQQLSGSVSDLLGRAARMNHSSPMVVGAIPFDRAKPAKLVVPTTVLWGGPLQFSSDTETRRPAESNSLPTYRITPVPRPEQYAQGVQQAIDRLRSGEMSKVVLSRALDLTSTNITIPIGQLLHSLARHNSHGYTFAVDLPKDHGGQGHSSSQNVLIGASPELLVRKTGNRVISNPLAGSAPRSKDPVEDRRIGEALLSSVKDLHEHAVVIEAVAEALRPFCRSLDVPNLPSLIQTETMWHLSTVVQGELLDPSISSLALAAALHPTPAVCGTPMELAREAIGQIEPYDRGFYTGMVGWSDAAGNGEWIVTIRCAEVYEHSLRLYAGAGIVSDSTPEGELAETSAKFRTMLNALGLHHNQL